MNKKLHIDIETYSSIDIFTSGAYKYMESVDFEILMVAYAFDDEQIKIVDLASGEVLPQKFIKALLDPSIEKWAHNANFERQAFIKYGYNIPVKQMFCSAVKAAYCGLPLSLAAVSEALGLGDKGKLATGKALIKFFSCPIKPTKANNNSHRNFPEADPQKWEEFKLYCIQDVEAEREICSILANYEICDFERNNYILDQKINDIGILVDIDMAKAAYDMDGLFSKDMLSKMKKLTGLENPNSPAQLKKWLSTATNKDIKTLAKDSLPLLIEQSESVAVKSLLDMRTKTSKSSVKKYTAMLNCACEDNRVRGLFQFYGANRTGRWAGRLVQLQNLPQNHLVDLKEARNLVKSRDYDHMEMVYDDISSVLSQLIRTTFIAKPNHTFAVADFSAIEARVVAWLANEEWRIDVFRGHGKIYEASAAMMFNVPIEEVTKGSDLRAKGKNAELALGYQGAIGAMKRMGGDKMGLSDAEMKAIVIKWRKANKAIVAFWDKSEKYAIEAFVKKQRIETEFRGIAFSCDEDTLMIHLPSGRNLSYREPQLATNKFGTMCLTYKGIDQLTKKWVSIDTYGGKIVENIVQALSRDILAHSMSRLDQEGFVITMHVHDEAICEIPLKDQENTLKRMCEIMSENIPWADGLPLNADGYLTEFYKKD